MRAALLFAFGASCMACSGGSSGPQYKSRDELLDPSTCAQCHKDHFNDWAVSMHAFASDDPVFRAMNKRGQRETNGALGNFCVNCHAPLAIHEGATVDGLNLDTVPQKLHGVTCFFCHTVDAVNGSHNNPLHLANDIVMRGAFGNPVANSAHSAAYSPLHDRTQINSASLCGSCHDIVTTQGAAIERTYSEWQQTVYAHLGGGDTCGQCHMKGSSNPIPIAQAPGVFARTYHAHDFPAVDVGLGPGSANGPTQQASNQAFLNNTLQSALCVLQNGNGAIRVILDNVAAGHSMPSGAAQDRRLWAEVIAYKAGQKIYESGVVPDGTPVTSLTNDPDLWLIRDCMLDPTGAPVSMFWQAASYESNLLPFPVTFDQTDPRYYQTHIVQSFPRDTTMQLPAMPDQVTLRIRFQPMGLDVLADLVQSGDLDPAIHTAMLTYDLGAQPLLTWTPSAVNGTYLENGRFQVQCVTASALNVAADKVQAVNHTKCQP